MTPIIQSFFDPETWTISHVLHSGVGSACAIIDSVLDYDHKSGRTQTKSADELIDFIQKNQLKLEWIIETHAHADHLSAAPYLKKTLGGKIAIGEHIKTVQGVFTKVFNFEPEFQIDGSQFDTLLKDNDVFTIGDLTVNVLAVPGHTPACIALQTGDHVFVGDTLFLPDVGTARCDFPGGDAAALYQSVKRILSLPPETTLHMCHDYPPESRTYQTSGTVAEQRASNIHVHDGVSMEEFIKMRSTRDATLAMPTLILPAVQVNVRAGQLPPAEDNGVRYLKIPLDVL